MEYKKYSQYINIQQSPQSVSALRRLQGRNGDLGPDFRKVVMLRNGAVRTKQNLSNAHEFVVC